MVTPVTDSDIIKSYERDESGLKGRCRGVFRPAVLSDITEIIEFARKEKSTLLVRGGGTSTTGSSVPFNDYVVSTEKLNRIVDLDFKKKILVVEAGVIVDEIKRFSREHGFFYPPDPTSKNECTIGGTVATNASGARGFYFGATERYVDFVEVYLSSGKKVVLNSVKSEKNSVSYFPFGKPYSFFVGSEGTLGFIGRIGLKLIDYDFKIASGFAFYKDMFDIIDAVVRLRKMGRRLNCLSFELIDDFGCSIIKKSADRFAIPSKSNAILFFEFKYSDENEFYSLVEKWLEFVEKTGGFYNDTVVVNSASDIEEFKRLRHKIPETFNSIADSYVESGGRKVATDFAVPVNSLKEILIFTLKVIKEAEIDFYTIYGHVANGHPHIDFRGKNRKEVDKLTEIAKVLCKKAVSLGGTVSAEHGIGKIKKQFLPIMYDDFMIEVMKKVKLSFDPHLMFAPGNIFDF